jgi:HD-like signal output (HDOD) protein/ActR/RegA family two-component response regulator
MSLKRILFVDDEEHVLDGLRNLFRRQRHVWNMVFVTSGEAALEVLEAGPSFDVIVSDMRMPGMDGATLLRRVKADHPGVVRIVLSGHAERAAMVRALAVAHQFLSKPCEADTLRAALERTCALRDLLDHEPIRRVVGQMDRLPSAPGSYWELAQALAQPDVAWQDVAAIIKRDSAMAVKVLQLVNSPFFGLTRQVLCIEQAVMYLGVDLLKGLALGAHVFATLPPVSMPGFSLDVFQRHAQLTAQLSRHFVSDPIRIDESFTAAMIHDIGQVVLALGMPAEFEDVCREARRTRRSIEEVEMRRLGVTHAEVGAYLLGLWGLPFPIVEAVAYHHVPSTVMHGPREVLAAVHVADAFADAAERGEGAEARIDMAFIEHAGLTARLPQWRAIAARDLRAVDAAATARA